MSIVLLRQHYYAIKNQLKTPIRSPYYGGISCPSLVLYGMRAAIIDLTLHGSHPYAIKNQRKARNAPRRGILYDIRELA